MPREIFAKGTRPMRVVLTGPLGIPSMRSFSQEVKGHLLLQGFPFEVFDVGERMYRNSPRVPPGGILNQADDVVEAVRELTYREIISEVNKLPSHVGAILNTRAVFRWSNALLPSTGISVDVARRFGADLFINLQDCAEVMHAGINNTEAFRPYGRRCGLDEVLSWREEEFTVTKLIADAVAGPNRIFLSSMVSRDRTTSRADVVAKLIGNPNQLKAYLSFPITHIMDNGKAMDEVAQFKAKLASKVLSFDPFDVEDWPLVLSARDALAHGRQFIDLQVNGQSWRIGVQEVLAVEQRLKAQIYMRDIVLVDQSDTVIQYIPEVDGKPAISQGAESEASRARNSGKPLHVIWKASARMPSPFCDWNAQISSSAQEVTDLLRSQGLI